LYIVHREGKQGALNEHFKPQHLGCFASIPPEKWKIVTTIGAPEAACAMRQLVWGDYDSSHGNSTASCALQKSHASLSSQIGTGMSPLDEPLLDAITRAEYKVLADYLP